MGKIARFELPNGRVAKFEVPDDYTPENAQAAIAEMLQQQQGPQQDERGFLARTFNPQREDFPQYPLGGTPEEALQTEQRMADPNASLSEDKFGNPLLVSKRGAFYVNRPGLSPADFGRVFDKAVGVARDVAPFLAAGSAAAPLRAGGAMAAQAATGLASEAINQTGNAVQGEDVSPSKLITTPALAAAGEGGARIAFRVLSPVFNRLLGSRAPQNLLKPDGSLSDDAIRALESQGVTAMQFDDVAQRELARMRQSGELTEEQAKRFNAFRERGLQPTRAQVTRSADDFQAQQEAAKTSTAVREALEGQEAAIAEAFDTTIRGTGGRGVSSGSPVADAVLNKASRLDQEISRLYQAARDAAPDSQIVKFNRLAANLKNKAPENQITNGLIRAIRGDLQSRGLIDKNFKPIGRASVETAEEVRKVLNQFWKSAGDRGRTLIDEFKNALDADVLTTFGDDLFKQARKAKATFEAGLRPERLSKFDANQRSLVREILENKIKPDDVFDRAILGKTWKASDLRELRNYLTRGSKEQFQAGQQAWNDLRAETMQYIRDQAFSNALDQTGKASMRSGAIKRALDKIGSERLGVLLSKDELKFLNDMARIESLRQPVPLTGIGKGPSAQAIASLENEAKKIANKLPFVGDLIEAIRANTQAVNALANPVSRSMDRATTAAVKSAVTTPGGAAGTLLEDRLTRER